MKKLILSIAAVAMIFATSCKKESVNEPETVCEPEANEFCAEIDANAVPQNMPAVKEGMTTKAYFDTDNKTVRWKQGDAIYVNGSADANKFTCQVTTEGQKRAYFSRPQGAYTAAEYHAFYGPITPNDNAASGTLLSDRTYDPDNNASNLPMYAYSANHWLTFKNICGVMRIIVPLSTANKIVVSADQAICGTFDVTNEQAVLNNTTSKTITVTRTSGTFQNGETVFVAVPGGTYTGLNIKFFSGSNSTPEWETGAMKSGSSATVTANQIHNVNLVGAFKGLLPGKFSVTSTKKVRFTTGNLWYNSSATTASKLFIEDSQGTVKLDFTGTGDKKVKPNYYDDSHVYYFYFQPTIAQAAAKQADATTYQTLFVFRYNNRSNITATAGSGANSTLLSDLYCLSNSEWSYLVGSYGTTPSVAAHNKVLYNYDIYNSTYSQNIRHIIVAPDGYTGTIPQYTTVEEYTKNGFLCLPRGGYTNYASTQEKDQLFSADGGRYAARDLDNEGNWWHLEFNGNGCPDRVYMTVGSRATGRNIRLVKDF